MDIITSYKDRKLEYEEFAKSIERILRLVLDENQIRFQSITSRSKDEESLTRKIIKKRYKNLEEVTDLAGCRIIFYLERDVRLFRSKLFEVFGRENIIEDNPKFSEDGYNANHLVVKFGEERLGLAEYSRFKNFVCEIQLTNVLYHSWSELNHDTFYKNRFDLEAFDKNAFENIKIKFNNIMKNHIKEAVVEYELAMSDYDKLEATFKFMQSENLINSSQGDNDEIYDFLVKLKKAVGRFGDKTPDQLRLQEILHNCLEKAKQNNVIDKSVYGFIFQGRNFEDILKESCEIYRIVCYQRPKEVVQFLFEYSSEINLSDHNNQWVSLIDKLFKPNIYVIQKVGYYLQNLALDELLIYFKSKKTINGDFYIYALSCLLRADFSSHSSVGRKITFSSGSVPYHTSLEDMRLRAYDALFEMYENVGEVRLRISVINALSRATVSFKGKTSLIEFADMMKKEKNLISEFFIDKAVTMSMPERMISSVFVNSNKEILSEENVEIFHAILESSDVAYLDDMILPKDKDWLIDDKLKDYLAKTEEKLSTLKDQDVASLKAYFLSIDDEIHYLDDRNYLSAFMQVLGKELPDLGLDIVVSDTKNLKKYLAPVLNGIYQRDKEYFELLSYTLLKFGFEIVSVLQCVSWKEDLSEEILLIAFKAMKTLDEPSSSIELINSVYVNQKLNLKEKNQLISSILDWLIHTKSKVSIQYARPFLGHAENKEIIKAQLPKLLEYVAIFDRVETVDYYLAEWAKIDPKPIIDMLISRIQHPRIKDFEPVPFDFNFLDKFMRTSPLETKNYFLKSSKKFRGDVLKKYIQLTGVLFSLDDEDFQNELIENMNSEEGIDFVYKLLDERFEPVDVDNILFVELMKKYRKGSHWIDDLYHILLKTGVSTGEDGELNKYKSKLNAIMTLKSDEANSSDMKEFLAEAEKRLEKYISQQSKIVEIRKGAEARDEFWDE